jgi:hypothetical protein
MKLDHGRVFRSLTRSRLVVQHYRTYEGLSSRLRIWLESVLERTNHSDFSDVLPLILLSE